LGLCPGFDPNVPGEQNASSIPAALGAADQEVNHGKEELFVDHSMYVRSGNNLSVNPLEEAKVFCWTIV
jgi:hypothetical protein